MDSLSSKVQEILQSSAALDRLNDWYKVGPVQRASLESFTDLVVKECIQVLRVEMYRLNRIPDSGIAAGALYTAQHLILNHFKEYRNE